MNSRPGAGGIYAAWRTVIWRTTNAASFSELYHANGSNGAYDNLDRLTDFRRGALSKSGGSSVYDTISSSSSTRSWTLDAQGNWGYNATGGTNAVNVQNQYTSATIAHCGGFITSSFIYDNNGNLSSRPNGADSGINDTFGYDAWDQMANFNHTLYVGNSVTQQDYNVDALGRRITVNTTSNGSGTISTDELYYSAAWQVLEDDRTIGSTLTRNQYVWSPTYVNDLVLRDRDTTHNGSFAERIYVQQDANHNVTAIVSATNGAVLERFVYDPYGVATVKSSTWGLGSDSKDWLYLFQGGRYDSNTGLINFQWREYDANLGRFITKDPTGAMYVDGANLYQFVLSNPTGYTDSTGLNASIAIPVLVQGAGVTAAEVAAFGEAFTNALPAGVATAAGGISMAAMGQSAIASQMARIGKQLADDVASGRLTAQQAIDLMNQAKGNVVETSGGRAATNPALTQAWLKAKAATRLQLRNRINSRARAERRDRVNRRASATSGGPYNGGNGPNQDPKDDENLSEAERERQKNIAKGIDPKDLGPSGKPKVHTVDHASRKDAKDAARNAGRSNTDPESHPSDKGQPAHFHSTRDGEKLEGKDNVHHNYPE